MTLSQLLKDATLFFLRTTPNITTVIPAMDHIDQVLMEKSKDRKYTPTI
jgi:hypothetical protein